MGTDTRARAAAEFTPKDYLELFIREYGGDDRNAIFEALDTVIADAVAQEKERADVNFASYERVKELFSKYVNEQKDAVARAVREAHSVHNEHLSIIKASWDTKDRALTATQDALQATAKDAIKFQNLFKEQAEEIARLRAEVQMREESFDRQWEHLVAKKVKAAVADRDMEWWEAIALVDNVPPTPEGCKWWVINSTEHFVKEAVAAERERIERELWSWRERNLVIGSMSWASLSTIMATLRTPSIPKKEGASE